MIGREIRALREEWGWTQVQLGQALGEAPETVSRWERGARTPEPYLRLAMWALDVIRDTLGDEAAIHWLDTGGDDE